jgi:hypothetical protein
MKQRSLDEIRRIAEVVTVGPETARARRRERLERFAFLLESYDGPLKLFSQVEFLPERDRVKARGDNSPLTVAFQDPIFKAWGLADDRWGEAIQFFGLTANEAHYLLCDCHYDRHVNGRMIASRTRLIARRLTLREVWGKFRDGVMAMSRR